MNTTHDRRWPVLAVMSLAILAIILSSSTIGIALPSIQKSLSATMAELQWMMNGYLLSFASLMLLSGWLGDRFGKKPVFLGGLAVFALANAAALLVDAAWQLVLLRVLMGLGSALILPTSLALIAEIFPEEERGKAIGVWAGMNSIGVALGPIVGGLLVQGGTWNSIFLANLPVALLALAAALILLPGGGGARKRAFDLAGSLASTGGLCLLSYGLTRSGAEGWGDALVLSGLAAGLLLLGLFVLLERSRTEPLFDLSLFRSRIFSVSVACLGLMSFGLVGITFALSLFLQFVLDFGPLAAGLRLLPLALGIFLGAGLSARFVKKSGARPVIVAGFLGTAASSACFALLAVDAPYSLFGPLLFLLSFFLGLVAAPATTGLMGSLPPEAASTGSAMNSVVRTVASAIGVALLGSLLSGIYGARFEAGLAAAPALAALPAAAAEAAGESIGAAMALASRLPSSLGGALGELARACFMAGWNAVAWVAAAMNLAGAALAFAFLPRAER